MPQPKYWVRPSSEWSVGEPYDRVYAVRCMETGRVKIGMSNKPFHRASTIQTCSPTKTVLELVIEGDREAERLLHAEFNDERVRGEWFAPSVTLERILAFIASVEVVV